MGFLFYILLWLSLIIFIIVVATSMFNNITGYYDYKMFNTIGIGCSCFGFFLFFLSIFLACVNISLSSYSYSGIIVSFNLFIIGSFFCRITSFFGSI